MKIQDFEARSGLDRATVRFYEKEGLLNPHRAENGYRDYSEADLCEVKKIKLLRQLGLPLEQIKELQQGRGNFSSAMDEQIHKLNEQIDQQQRSHALCVEMRNASVEYATLNADYYLQRLNAPSVEITKEKPALFTEHIRREVHPWRRLLARFFDRYLLLTLVNLLIYVIFRQRTMPDYAPTLFGYLSYWALVPVEVLMLHYIGTTPGKLLFGIRVESAQGGKLPLTVAINREFGVLQYGHGFGIPFYQLYRLYRSHTDLCEGPNVPWDNETEITYHRWNGGRTAIAAVFCCLMIALSAFCSADLMLPANRGELTVSDFAENYTYYHEKVMKRDTMHMNPDGTWKKTKQSPNHVILDINGEHDYPDFTYTIEEGVLTEIRYEDQWKGNHHVYIFPNYLTSAVMAYAAAQPGMGPNELYSFSEKFDAALSNARKDGMLNFNYGDLHIHWEIKYENGTLVSLAGDYAIMTEQDRTDPNDEKSLTVELIFYTETI